MSETNHAEQAPVTIITAAGKGMGGATARRLARDGHRLALMSNSGGAEELADELGCIGRAGSVTELPDLEALVDATLEEFGRSITWSTTPDTHPRVTSSKSPTRNGTPDSTCSC